MSLNEASSMLADLATAARSSYLQLQLLLRPVEPNGHGRHDGMPSRHGIKRLSLEVTKLYSLIRGLELTSLSLTEEDVEGDKFNLVHLKACAQKLHDLAAALVAVSGHGSRMGDSEIKELEVGIRSSETSLRLGIHCESAPAFLQALSTTGDEQGRVLIPSRAAPDELRGLFFDTIEMFHTLKGMQSEQLHQYLTQRSKGSLQRTIQEGPLRAWLDLQDPACVWLHGPAGCGKTVLASAVIEAALSRATISTATCFYFHSSYGERPLQTDSILRILISQLAIQSPEACALLRKMFSVSSPPEPAEFLSAWEDGTLWKNCAYLGRCFGEMAAVFTNVFVILDGINSPAEDLATAFHSIWSAEATAGRDRVRILVLGRDLPGDGPLSSAFDSLQWIPEDGDICKFVQDRLRRDGISQSEPQLADDIEHALASRHQGFLLAHTQLDYLLSFATEEERRNRLHTLPTSLEDIYQAILEQNQDGDATSLGLSPLVLSIISQMRYQRASVREMAGALSVGASREATSRSAVSWIPEARLLRMCNGSLVHHSDTIYLSSPLHGFVSESALMAGARHLPALHALRYLNFPEFGRLPSEAQLERDHMRRRTVDHPFYRYAAAWWPSLAIHNNSIEHPEVVAQIKRLFSHPTSPNFVSWIVEYCCQHFPAKYGSTFKTQPFADLLGLVADASFSPLHVAASFGLADICQYLLDQGVDANLRSPIGTPLHCALVGPHVLQTWMGEVSWKLVGLPPYVIDQKKTVQTLLAVGAVNDPETMDKPVMTAKAPSAAAAALLASAVSNDVELFTSAISHTWLLDQAFLDAFRYDKFPFDWAQSKLELQRHALPEARKNYFNGICEHVMDVLAVPWPYGTHRSILEVCWQRATAFRLPCADLLAKRLLTRLDDEHYERVCSVTLKGPRNVHVIRRLVQDPRWNPSAALNRADASSSSSSSSSGSDSDGQNILHDAVESGKIELIDILLRSGGADHSARDAKGRTPLLLCEKPEVLKVLVEHGADLDAADDEGRTLWHYAAANGDLKLLEALMATVKDTAPALKRTTKLGRTPLAEAFAYVHELIGLPPGAPDTSPAKGVQSAQLLLEHIGKKLADADGLCSPEFFKSDVPLVAYAATWGSQPLLTSLQQVAAPLEPLMPDGSTALHHINFSATRFLISNIRECLGDACKVGDRTVRDLIVEKAIELMAQDPKDSAVWVCKIDDDCSTSFSRRRQTWEHLEDEHDEWLRKVRDGIKAEHEVLDIPVLDKEGRSPAETIFLNFKPDCDNCNPTRHPSYSKKLDALTYQALLTEEVIKSKDSEGRTLWERFCHHVVLQYSSKASFWPRVAESIVLAVRYLNAKGALAEHEEVRQTSAVLALVDAVWDKSDLIPPWLSELLVLVLETTKHFDKVKDEPNVTLTLQWVANRKVPERKRLLDDLLSRGVSIHSVARGLSTLSTVCGPGDCDIEHFKLILEYADKSRLNETSAMGRTALQQLCIANEEASSAVGRMNKREEKLKLLLQAGADPNLSLDGMPTIIVTIFRMQFECAKILIENGADLTLQTEEKIDVALAAASRGSLTVLEALKAKAGADWKWDSQCNISLPPLKDFRKLEVSGCNAMHLAAMNGHPEPIRFYIENGFLQVDDASTDKALTPLHFAAMGGSAECIRLLLEKGANKEGLSTDKATPLHSAVRSRQPDSVAALLAAKVELDPADLEGVTPLIEAIRINAPRCSKMLLEAHSKKGAENARRAAEIHGKCLADALEVAIKHMDHSMCLTVLEYGGDVDAFMPGCKGCTALMLAVRQGKDSLVRMLLDKGAKRLVGHCSKHSPGGYNALFEACINRKSVACIKPLLDAALRLGHNWLTANVTPVHVTCEHNNPKALEVVLKHVEEHADEYSAWVAHLLPVQHPIAKAEIADADSLAARTAPADLDSADIGQTKKTGLEEVGPPTGPAAEQPDMPKEVDTLKETMPSAAVHSAEAEPAPVRSSANDSAPEGSLAQDPPADGSPAQDPPAGLEKRAEARKAGVHPVIRHLLDRKLVINRPDVPFYNGYTALHVAMSSDNIELVKVLLDHGAWIDARDGQLNTPLQMAVREPFAEAVSVLLERGADTRLVDNCGETALMRAVSEGELAIVQDLVKHGADPSVTDMDGQTLLKYCAQNSRRPDLFHYLASELHMSPYDRDKTGFSPIHEALLNGSMTAHVLNGSYDIFWLAEQPDVAKSLLSLVIYEGESDLILPRLLRRIPPHRRDYLINVFPPRYVSPLCNAATRGASNDVEVLLRFGARLDMEGAPEGSALMSACAHGRLHTAKLLVRSGAQISYRSESGVLHSAVDAAKHFPGVVNWLLVGRWTDQPQLCWAEDNGSGLDQENGQGHVTYSWSGPFEVGILMTGTYLDYMQAQDESGEDFLKRMASVRRSLQGKVVVPVDENAAAAPSGERDAPSRVVIFPMPMRESPVPE